MYFIINYFKYFINFKEMQKNEDNNDIQKNIQIQNHFIIDSEAFGTDSTESQKNPSINYTPSINGINGPKIENLKLKKKKRVSFIDQGNIKKDIAQIIYINDRASLNEDRKNSNKYLEQIKKQNINISDNIKKENQNNTEMYRIKRPKKSLFSKRKIDKKDERCTCIIY